MAGLGYLHVVMPRNRPTSWAPIFFTLRSACYAAVLRVIQAKYGQGGSQLRATINPGNRVGYVRDEIDTLPKTNYVKTTPQFRRFTSRLAMRPYTAQEVKSGV